MKQPTKLIKAYLSWLSVRNNCERNTMKEITGKAKHCHKSNFPRKLKIGNKTETGEYGIGNEFSRYYSYILQILVHL